MVVGGLTRIGKVAELVSPIMCAAYLLVGLVILALNLDRLPGVLEIMFRSAFSKDSIYGAIWGTMVQWGGSSAASIPTTPATAWARWSPPPPTVRTR